MKALYRLNHGLNKIETWILSWSILVMATVLIINAVGRTIFHFSITAISEISLFLVMFLTYIGLSNAARRGSHIVMTAVLDMVPRRVKKIMCVFSALVTLAFLAYMVVLSYRYTAFVYANNRMLPALNIPMWSILAIMPVGFGLAAFQYLLTLLSNLTRRGKIFIGPEVEYVAAEAEPKAEKAAELPQQTP